MDRRTSIAALFGRQRISGAKQVKVTTIVNTAGTGLNPYMGEWTFEQASHLLRRAMFGPTKAQILDAVNNGMAATVDTLLTETPAPSPPLNYQDEMSSVPIGESWVDATLTVGVNGEKGRRRASLFGWQVGNGWNEGVSIQEKLLLFWHNHFVTSAVVVDDPRFNYNYIENLRSYSLGNFKEFAKAMTIDVSMLRYLNGNQNRKEAPNENYARELLELFTIGKGELAGPGDYTTFTEDDVLEIARVLTGWVDRGFNANNVNNTAIESQFFPNRHDTEVKQLSHRFDNVEIENGGDEEYKTLIDIIFQQDEVARFICRKLYRYFVYYIIDELTEDEVILPMAQMLIDNDYEIKPVLEALLKSEHFFDILNAGPMIKNPIDFFYSIVKPFQVGQPDNFEQRYRQWVEIAGFLPALQMQFLNPPNVAGWQSYYQDPQYYRIWINSVTLPLRFTLTDFLIFVGQDFGPNNYKIDVLAFAATLDNAADPNELITESAAILFPRPITDNQVTYLKSIILQGLPDFEWTVEYNDYLADPTNDQVAIPIQTKLRLLYRTMLQMPEFYLS